MEPMIRELSQSERPREKMERMGERALSDEELMAIFLRTGMRGKSAIQLGRELLQQAGSLSRFGQLSLAEMKKIKGIGPAKACELKAAIELGVRVARSQSHGVALDSPEVIYQHFAPQLQNLTKERLVVALLNAKLHLLASVDISEGTVSETLAHPREILHPVVNRNAYAFFLMHNHPSGDPQPSRADVQLTSRLREASELMQIRFIDHVIIGTPAAGRSPYFSFRESGQL